MTRKLLHRHLCVITHMGGWHLLILTLVQSVKKVFCKCLLLSLLCVFTHRDSRTHAHTHTYTKGNVIVQ